LPASTYGSIVASGHRSWSVLCSNYRFDVQNGLWEILAGDSYARFIGWIRGSVNRGFSCSMRGYVRLGIISR
jgi:hypothetical protein